MLILSTKYFFECSKFEVESAAFNVQFVSSVWGIICIVLVFTKMTLQRIYRKYQQPLIADFKNSQNNNSRQFLCSHSKAYLLHITEFFKLLAKLLNTHQIPCFSWLPEMPWFLESSLRPNYKFHILTKI